MSLNKIELPGIVIADLYKNTLIAETEVQQQTVTDNTTYKFLGNNQKKITMIVNEENVAFLPEPHLNFISKILEACKMNIADVAIVNQQTKAAIVGDIKKQLAPAFIILFGITPVEIKLPIDFPQFKPQAYDGCTYLYAPALDTLNQDSEEGKLLKSKLWVCLRKLFEV
jgi:hypothetical protein